MLASLGKLHNFMCNLVTSDQKCNLKNNLKHWPLVYIKGKAEAKFCKQVGNCTHCSFVWLLQVNHSVIDLLLSTS